MKNVAASLVAVTLVGCADFGSVFTNRPTGYWASGPATYQPAQTAQQFQYGQQSQAISYTQLDQITKRMSERDCPNIESHIKFLETQLQLRGLQNVTPENLNDDDRMYNANARIAIWSLRIGCHNRDRYRNI
jgi:hypothetical protein